MRALFRHRHRWTTTDVQHTRMALTGVEVTRLLQRCRCGAFDTEDLFGAWPAERFTTRPRSFDWMEAVIPLCSVVFIVDNFLGGFYLVAALWGLITVAFVAMVVAGWRRRRTAARVVAAATAPPERSPS